MILIDNWRNAWRFASVWAMTAATALQGAWLALPDELRVLLPSWLPHTTAIALLALGVVARVVKQDSVRDYKD